MNLKSNTVRIAVIAAITVALQQLCTIEEQSFSRVICDCSVSKILPSFLRYSTVCCCQTVALVSCLDLLGSRRILDLDRRP